jgi:hypothetical protein
MFQLWYRLTLRALMLVMVLAALACAGWAWWVRRVAPGPPLLQGQVSVRGQPVNGRITLLPRDPAGQPAEAPIVDGHFVLRGLADGRDMAGLYDVGIVGPGVPAKYQARETSGLMVRLPPGMLTTAEFELR